MNLGTKHECGGKAFPIGGRIVQGWNKYCCGRCGMVFYYWITEQMLHKKNS